MFNEGFIPRPISLPPPTVPKRIGMFDSWIGNETTPESKEFLELIFSLVYKSAGVLNSDQLGELQDALKYYMPNLEDPQANKFVFDLERMAGVQNPEDGDMHALSIEGSDISNPLSALLDSTFSTDYSAIWRENSIPAGTWRNFINNRGYQSLNTLDAQIAIPLGILEDRRRYVYGITQLFSSGVGSEFRNSLAASGGINSQVIKTMSGIYSYVYDGYQTIIEDANFSRWIDDKFNAYKSNYSERVESISVDRFNSLLEDFAASFDIYNSPPGRTAEAQNRNVRQALIAMRQTANSILTEIDRIKEGIGVIPSDLILAERELRALMAEDSLNPSAISRKIETIRQIINDYIKADPDQVIDALLQELREGRGFTPTNPQIDQVKTYFADLMKKPIGEIAGRIAVGISSKAINRNSKIEYERRIEEKRADKKNEERSIQRMQAQHKAESAQTNTSKNKIKPKKEKS